MTVRCKVTYIVWPKKANLELDDYKIVRCEAPVGNIPQEYRTTSKTVVFSAKGKGIPVLKKFDVMLDGTWSFDEKKYGLTLNVTSASIVPPSDKEGIINYLVMFLDGCGKGSARRIYNAFGSATIMVLQDAPEKLYTVPGLRKKSIEKMIISFERTKALVELTTLLSPFNLGKKRIEYIFNMLGPDSAEIIKKNPFVLQDYHGIGFETMEVLSQKFNCDPKNPLRIKAALKYCVSKAASGSNDYLFDNQILRSGGNLFIEQHDLFNTTKKILNQGSSSIVSDSQIKSAMKEMKNDSELLSEDDGNVYLPGTYFNERKCARNIVTLLTESEIHKYKGEVALHALFKAEQDIGIELSKNQRQAVMCVLANPLSVITGGAGTGKSTVLRVILEALKILGENPGEVLLTAPTGKAAIRMTECTDYPACTLHKALGLMNDEDYWVAPEDYPSVNANLVVVDEFSMADMFISYRLFAQIDLRHTRVLLVGDVGQLPSVSAGDVLNQIIESRIIPTVKLNTIFRQAQESNIVKNSLCISEGNIEGITFDNDCSFYESKNESEILDHVLQTYMQQIQKYGIDGTIILCPVKGKIIAESGNSNPPDKPAAKQKLLCTNYINLRIQALVNPPSPDKIEAKVYGRVYRVGDKVIQLKNKVFKQQRQLSDDNTTNTSVDVCNGDIGIIQAIKHDDYDGYSFFIEFAGDRYVELNEEEIKDITLAYCLTVHKSQGSEYSAVILPLYESYNPNMMTRKLIYTAVTRAKKELFVIGDSNVLNWSINNAFLRRNTVLAKKIQDYYQEEIDNESITY